MSTQMKHLTTSASSAQRRQKGRLFYNAENSAMKHLVYGGLLSIRKCRSLSPRGKIRRSVSPGNAWSRRRSGNRLELSDSIICHETPMSKSLQYLCRFMRTLPRSTGSPLQVVITRMEKDGALKFQTGGPQPSGQ